MLVLCWAGVADVGPTSSQHWVNILFLIGGAVIVRISYLQIQHTTMSYCQHNVKAMMTQYIVHGVPYITIS